MCQLLRRRKMSTPLSRDNQLAGCIEKCTSWLQRLRTPRQKRYRNQLSSLHFFVWLTYSMYALLHLL
jgi:hypothetical protein